LDWVFVACGLVILVLAGDALVTGAVNLALRAGIPALIVSLTIVAFGTSAPELLVSVSAVLDHAPGIALGNVVGSNTANILRVLGVPALIAGIRPSGGDTTRSHVAMLAATVLFILLCFAGPLRWWHGLVLLAGLGWTLCDQARAARSHRRARGEARDVEVPEGTDAALPGWRIAALLILGLVGLPLGAHLLVEGAVSIARGFGVSETAIGLTLVAVGTSLPELATSVSAALRRQADVVLGNVIGSNIFNLLAIIGITCFVGRIPVDPGLLRVDLWVMAGASLLLAPFVFRGWPLSRPVGAVLTMGYLSYLMLVFV